MSSAKMILPEPILKPVAWISLNPMTGYRDHNLVSQGCDGAQLKDETSVATASAMGGKRKSPHCTRLKSWNALKQMPSKIGANTMMQGATSLRYSRSRLSVSRSGGSASFESTSAAKTAGPTHESQFTRNERTNLQKILINPDHVHDVGVSRDKHRCLM